MTEKYFDIHEADLNIRCKLYSAEGRAVSQAVIFGHGFGGHKDNKAAERFAKRMIDRHPDAAVVTFNWPCHGDDVRKTLRLSDCDAYLDAVLRDTKARFGAERIFGYATSFGGYLFLRYIGLHGNPFLKLALRCPAVDMYRVLTQSIISEDELASLEKGKSAMIGFDRKIKIDRTYLDEVRKDPAFRYDYSAYADDILILHGTADEIVPFEMVQRFADEQGLLMIPSDGADHRFIDPRKMDEAIKMIIDFFEEI